MDPIYQIIILLVLMAVFIYLSGWFSGTETALTHLGAAQLGEMKEEKVKNVEYILKLKKEMDRTLVALLIGNNLVNIVLSSVAALMANALFKEVGVSIMVGLITFLIIIFGEITPKSSAIIDSKKVAQKNAKILYHLTRFLSPLITFFIWISSGVLKLLGRPKTQTGLLVSDDAIKNLVNLGESEGVIKRIERDIIHKVFHFGDKKIADIMVPMAQVFSLAKDCSVTEASEKIAERGFTRVPIMEGDEAVGILHSKDIIHRNEGVVEPLMRSPYFVYSTDDITDIFKSMERRRRHLAVVKDHGSGKHVGIVTLEDILEEIVGEIHDEFTEAQDKLTS